MRLADNKLAELGSWDEDLLRLEFEALLELDLQVDLSFDIGITGFASAEIDRLIDAEATPFSEPAADDEIPTTDHDTAAVSQLGDVWQLNEHRVICGDAREADVYDVLLGDERATMGIHDAPYNVSIKNHVSRSGKHAEFVMASGEMAVREFITFLTRFLK